MWHLWWSELRGMKQVNIPCIILSSPYRINERMHPSCICALLCFTCCCSCSGLFTCTSSTLIHSVSQYIIYLWLLCMSHRNPYLFRCWPAYMNSREIVLSFFQTDPTGWVQPCGIPPWSLCDIGNISGRKPSCPYWRPPWAEAEMGTDGVLEGIYL